MYVLEKKEDINQIQIVLELLLILSNKEIVCNVLEVIEMFTCKVHIDLVALKDEDFCIFVII